MRLALQAFRDRGLSGSNVASNVIVRPFTFAVCVLYKNHVQRKTGAGVLYKYHVRRKTGAGTTLAEPGRRVGCYTTAAAGTRLRGRQLGFRAQGAGIRRCPTGQEAKPE